jgi:hypothetical protein
MEDARAAYKVLGEQRKSAREAYERAFDRSADAEREYRKALAQAFVSVEGGTAAEREANARARVSDLSYQRDLSAGLIKVAHERLNEIDAHRQSLNRLCEWSMKLDPLATEQRQAHPVRAA